MTKHFEPSTELEEARAMVNCYNLALGNRGSTFAGEDAQWVISAISSKIESVIEFLDREPEQEISPQTIETSGM